eukprot:2168083-Prymnesium_polylepis.1
MPNVLSRISGGIVWIEGASNDVPTTASVIADARGAAASAVSRGTGSTAASYACWLSMGGRMMSVRRGGVCGRFSSAMGERAET